MAIISVKTDRVSLRTILALSYTLTFTLLVGIAFYAIYIVSEDHRQDEFSRRLKDRTLSTFRILLEVEQIDRDILQIFDKNTINSLSDEKILLFDSSGAVIYSSIDDTRINYPVSILNRLRSGESYIELTEHEYELVGISFRHHDQIYYGIAKANDQYGKSKLDFLKLVLIASFCIVAGMLFLLSLYLARIITAPITRLTKSIGTITPDNLSVRLPDRQSTEEVSYLATRFNELLEQVENAFRFQYHFIHHISHELKTPLAVMIANAERALAEDQLESYKASLQFQKNALMDLSHIINAMMEISRTEHQLVPVRTEPIRIDELLFECMDELNYLFNKVQFDFRLDQDLEHGESLAVSGNSRMLKMALMNMLKNALLYSEEQTPVIELKAADGTIRINIINDGQLLSAEEQEQLFRHLFRGANSRSVKGFGLGLVLTRRIIELHGGAIAYTVTEDHRNCFSVTLPAHH